MPQGGTRGGQDRAGKETRTLGVSLTVPEYDRLLELANLTDRSLASVVRNLILRATVVDRDIYVPPFPSQKSTAPVIFSPEDK